MESGECLREGPAGRWSEAPPWPGGRGNCLLMLDCGCVSIVIPLCLLESCDYLWGPAAHRHGHTHVHARTAAVLATEAAQFAGPEDDAPDRSHVFYV